MTYHHKTLGKASSAPSIWRQSFNVKFVISTGTSFDINALKFQVNVCRLFHAGGERKRSQHCELESQTVEAARLWKQKWVVLSTDLAPDQHPRGNTIGTNCEAGLTSRRTATWKWKRTLFFKTNQCFGYTREGSLWYIKNEYGRNNQASNLQFFVRAKWQTDHYSALSRYMLAYRSH